jgi:hypothetical protein
MSQNFESFTDFLIDNKVCFSLETADRRRNKGKKRQLTPSQIWRNIAAPSGGLTDIISGTVLPLAATYRTEWQNSAAPGGNLPYRMAEHCCPWRQLTGQNGRTGLPLAATYRTEWQNSDAPSGIT